MTEEFSNERLELVLRSVGQHLELPSSGHVPPVTAGAARRRVRAARRVAVAAALAVVVSGVLIVPAARTAVADLLGIGSTDIEITGERAPAIDGLPHIAQDLDPISTDEAVRIIGTELPDMSATRLGPPAALYHLPEGGVLLAWQADEASLWIRPNADAEAVVTKLVGSGELIETVDGLGTRALLITDTHILQTPQRRLAAGTVLLWYDDAYEYRFEADLSPTALVDLARSID